LNLSSENPVSRFAFKFKLYRYTAGLTAGKVTEPLYLWRQYPAQSTRTHDRCSLEQLRACKVHFLLGYGGVARGRPVQVWGTGETLKAWVGDLRR
jgi:hypothetical protein